MPRILPFPFLAAIAFSSLAVAQVHLEFGPSANTYVRVLSLPSGDRLLVGSAPTNTAACFACTRRQLSVTVLGSSGASFAKPQSSGSDVPVAAAVDPQGNLWIVGNTDSGDFPLVNPVVAQKAPGRVAGFVMEFNPTGKVLFATYLGGNQPSSLFGTHATAIAIDKAGNAYMGGDTNEPDFPTTPGAFLRSGPGVSGFEDVHSYSYLVKISPAGKLVYSTFLTSGGGCDGSGSGCIGRQSSSATVSSIAVDADGIVTLAGGLGGRFNSITHCTYSGGGYVSRVAADGSKMLSMKNPPFGSASFVALDSVGRTDVFGSYPSYTYSSSSLCPVPAGGGGLFAAQFNPDGSDFAWAKDFGKSSIATTAGMLVDAHDNIYLAGSTTSPQFPQVQSAAPNLGADFVQKLDSSGSPARSPLRLPEGVIVAPPSFDANGNLILVGAQNSVLTVPADYSGQGPPAIVAFANAATYALNTGLYPGALVTLWGFNLPASSAGLQVLVSGSPAPILYAGPNQINIQAPFKNAYYISETVQLGSGPDAPSFDLPVSASLGIFTTDGVHAAALNQDGTVNSSSNPAPYGSIVSLFGTGALWPSGTQEGAIPADAMPFNPDLNKFEVISGNGTPLNILYAGAAPGIIDGVFQINVQLTETASGPTGEYGITLRRSGNTTSNTCWFTSDDDLSQRPARRPVCKRLAPLTPSEVFRQIREAVDREQPAFPWPDLLFFQHPGMRVRNEHSI
jgi:uncharacterized protein (TIGR03437 family)